jgi:hypothetical protein
MDILSQLDVFEGAAPAHSLTPDYSRKLSRGVRKLYE